MSILEEVFLALFFICIAGIGVCMLHKKDNISFTDDQAIAAIVGEYSKQDYSGMKIFAHAIRNRKTLRGVYGLYAKHSRKESKTIWELATLAWYESAAEVDTSFGSTAWYSRQDYERHHIPKGMKISLVYGNTIFFKPIKKEKKP